MQNVNRVENQTYTKEKHCKLQIIIVNLDLHYHQACVVIKKTNGEKKNIDLRFYLYNQNKEKKP